MKRLNPKTGLPFRRGDVREDGKIFMAYRTDKKRIKNGFFTEDWLSESSFKNQLLKSKNYNDNLMTTKSGHINRLYRGTKNRAKETNVPFSIDLEYLISIAPDVCPVFKEPLSWTKRHGKKPNALSPSLDKIVPELGYVKGNVQWLSQKANTMKQNANPAQLMLFADWIMSQYSTPADASNDKQTPSA
jgi:hypothetical protein